MENNNFQQLTLFIIILLTPSIVLSNNEDLSTCANVECNFDGSGCPDFDSVCNTESCVDLLSSTPDGIMNYSCFANSPRDTLDLVDTVIYDGYLVETHYVTTEDGYIITIFRITKPGCVIDGSKKPIVLVHGLFLGAFFWLVPDRNHAYIYADLCYEVWLLNVRGNTYGRNHTTINPDTDPSFWNFDFNKMAMKDLPACLDYVLATTGQTQVIYIGHSQGVTIIIVLLALRPEYNDKMFVIFAISTTAWLNHANMPVLLFGQYTSIPVGVLLGLGFNTEILKQGGVLQTAAEVGCGTTTLTYPLCTIFVFFFFRGDKCEVDCQTLGKVVYTSPQGTSLKTFQMWNEIRATNFTQKDYGYLNQLYYGTSEPPEYPLQNVRAKMIFFVSCGDNVSTWQDMETLLSKLTNSNYEYCLINCMTHIGGVIGTPLKDKVADPILNYLSTGTLVCPTAE